MSYKPYVITSPPFEITSGGVRVMYGLYGALLAKGQIAFLNQKPSHGDFIAIYPEIEHGNPAEASTIVRYILAKPGEVDAIYTDGSIKKGPKEFDPNDKIYYFSRLCGEAQSENQYMFLPILNLHLFKDQKKIRNKTAYFVGKGIKNPNIRSKFIHPDDAILIDREFAQDQGVLVDLLNECEVLYCYDYRSAMTEVARLCGCRVVIIADFYTKEEFSEYEPGMNGISWGKDEGIHLEIQAFRERYESLVHTFEYRLDRFIEDTQE